MENNNNTAHDNQPEMSNPFIFTMQSLRQSSRDLLTQVQAKIASGDQFTVDTESAVLQTYVLGQVKEIQGAIAGKRNDNGMDAFFTILSMYITVGQLRDDGFFSKLASACGVFIAGLRNSQEDVLSGTVQGVALAKLLHSFDTIIENTNLEPDTESFSKILYLVAQFIAGSLNQEIDDTNEEDLSSPGIFDTNDYTADELARIRNIEEDAFETAFKGVSIGGLGFKNTLFSGLINKNTSDDKAIENIHYIVKGLLQDFDKDGTDLNATSLLKLLSLYVAGGLSVDDSFMEKLSHQMMLDNSMAVTDIFKESYRSECLVTISALLQTIDGKTPMTIDAKAFSGVLAAAVLEMSNASQEDREKIFGPKRNSDTDNTNPPCYSGPTNPMRLCFLIDMTIVDVDQETSMALAEKIIFDFYTAKAKTGNTNVADDFIISGSMTTLKNIQHLSVVHKKIDPMHYYFF